MAHSFSAPAPHLRRLLPLAASLAACTSTEHVTDVGPFISSNDAACAYTLTEPALDELTATGWRGVDLLHAIQAEGEGRLIWSDGSEQTGHWTMTLDPESVRSHELTGDPASHCFAYLSVDLDLAVWTDDGLLDEAWTVDLLMGPAAPEDPDPTPSAASYEAFDELDVEGSWELPLEPGVELTRASLRVGTSAEEVELTVEMTLEELWEHDGQTFVHTWRQRAWRLTTAEPAWFE